MMKERGIVWKLPEERLEERIATVPARLIPDLGRNRCP